MSVSGSGTIFSQGDLKTDTRLNNQTLRKNKTIYEDLFPIFCMTRRNFYRHRKYSNIDFLFCIEIIIGKFHHSIYYIHFHFTIEMQICLQINTQGTEDLFDAIATRVQLLSFTQMIEVWKKMSLTIFLCCRPSLPVLTKRVKTNQDFYKFNCISLTVLFSFIENKI